MSAPISPPTTSDPSDPLSPLHRTSTFPHKTSPAVSSQTPLIDTRTPAINAAPVELDGASVSVQSDGTSRQASRAGGTGIVIGGSTRSPADEEDIDGEFLGEGNSRSGMGVSERAAMLASRSKDPGVIVDVPRDPTAEEVLAAKSADGMVTPGVVAGRGMGE